MKRISVVIPVFNEELVIPELGKRLTALMDRNKAYQFEIVLVDNGSVDNSFREIMTLHERDPRFKIVQLSRNFTADGGVAAGIRFCTGDCVVLMDADLQDPPEVVDEFIAKWEEGYDTVFGIIQSRKKVSGVRRFFNKLFYWTIAFVTKGMIHQNVTAFRLMDRRVYKHLNRMGEANRFTRGLSSWLGYRQVGVPFHREGRYCGESKVNFFDLFKEGTDAVFAFSTLPLKLVTLFGACLSALCLLFILVEVSIYLFYQSPFPGYRTIIVLNMMMFGFIFLSLGILGEYIGRIFDNVKGRPNFIVSNLVGIDKNFARTLGFGPDEDNTGPSRQTADEA